MIKCAICGHEKKYRLIEHIQKTHKMDIKDYYNLYGEYVSIEYTEKVSEKSKEMWSIDEYREKTIKNREYMYTSENYRKKQSDSGKLKYINGFKVWNSGKTKLDDDRLKSIGEKNSKNLKGRTKEKYEYLMKNSEKMKEMWSNENSNMTYATKCLNEEQLLEWKRKISETLSRKIASGELNTKSNFKCGYYHSAKSDSIFFYSSNLELQFMEIFDGADCITEWTKHHKIRVKYIKKSDGLEHYYVPDFALKCNNELFIIESKGYPDDDIIEKMEAIKKIYKNYKIFYNVKQLKEFIDEIGKNK